MPRTPEQFEEIREKTKQRILEHSLKLFATKGYHGTSINDIAKSAGISKGLAYNYFESKQKIAEAILKQMLEMGEAIESQLDWDDDPYKVLNKLITVTFDFISGSEDFWKMYISFALQPDIIEEAREVSTEFTDVFLKKMTKLFKKMGMPNAKEEAYMLGALFDGVSLHYLMGITYYSLSSIKKSILKKYGKEELSKRINSK